MNLLLVGRGNAARTRVMVGGFTASTWLGMWFACHGTTGMGGFTRLEWPDGGCLLAQSAITVEVFAVINKLVSEEMARQREATT